VKCNLEALPKLQAEDALYLSTIVAVGNGTLKKGEGDKILREWRATARKNSVHERPSKQQLAIIMAGMGIKWPGKN
jgi:hypothetical protein